VVYDAIAKGLVNDSLKSQYLSGIWNDDQNPRRMKQVGLVDNRRDSIIHHNDSLNLIKVEAYLKYWTYPNKSDFDLKERQSLITVIHHIADVEVKEKYFPIFYKAFKEGKIRGTSFTFYLQRWHDMKFGERVEFDRPFTEEEELAKLYDNLKLPEGLIIYSFSNEIFFILLLGTKNGT